MTAGQLIGVVVPNVTNPFYGEFAAAIEADAARLGHEVVVWNALSEGRIEDGFLAEAVNALIVVGLHPGPVGGRFATDPTIWVDVLEPVHDGVSIATDLETGSRKLIEHLIDVHARRRVALVIGGGLRGEDPRQRGWRTALTTAGLTPGPVETTSWSMQGGREAGRSLASRTDRPDAIYAASDLLALGVLRAVQEAGLRVPDDIAVVSCDGTEASEFTIPRLTTLQQPIAEMSHAAVQAVVSGDRARTGHWLLDGEVAVRESCGCCTRAAVVVNVATEHHLLE